MCEKCGTRCPTCGHAPGERIELPPAPQEPDPDGRARLFTCRYCSDTFSSAEAVAEHQERRHIGVGRQMVSDVSEWHRVG